MKKMTQVVVALVSLGIAEFPSTALAAGTLGLEKRPSVFSYDQFELDVVFLDDLVVDRGSSLDGVRFSGSVNIEPNLALTGSVMDASGNRSDFSMGSVGAAYHQKLEGTQLKESDFIIHANLEAMRVVVDPPVGKRQSDNDLGVRAGAGLRVRVVKELEVFGDLSFRTTLDNDLVFEAGGRYAFTPKLHGTASVEIGDIDIVSAGIRYYFD
jgi:hypothetical protein